MKTSELTSNRNTPSAPSNDAVVELGRAPAPGIFEGGSGGASAPLVVQPYFDPQTVVSLDVHGAPRSRYGEARWDLSAQSSDGLTAVNLSFFEMWSLGETPEISRPNIAALIREQHKALIWLHMDAGQLRAQGTVQESNYALMQLAKAAHRRGMTLFEILCDPQILGEESSKLNLTRANSANSVLKTFWRNREFLQIGVEIRLKALREAISKAIRDRGDIATQTPIIPSRIYCAILGGLITSLDAIDLRLDTLLHAYRQERTAGFNAPKGLTDAGLTKYRKAELEQAAESMRVFGYAGRGSLQNFISGQIGAMQCRLMNLVIAFTGMRFGEAQILPLKGVLEEVEHQGKMHHVVNGYSHKLSNGIKRPASWVTSQEGRRAIVLARRISMTILDVLKGRDPTTDERALLFCATSNPYKKKDRPAIYGRTQPHLIAEICPLITQADIDELNSMELERGWEREGIEVGKPWPLAFHQLRRSLSVYAHRSGMVSLPALKGQLQHITDEMRAYYSDGFCRAVNLVFDKEHFSHDWNAAKSESSFLAYSLALLFSDEDLIGGIGGRGAARMEETVSNRPKHETLKLFRDGKLAYQETVLGGCTAVEGCDRTPLEPIPWECLEKDCANAVVFGKRLGLLIKTQEAVVSTLTNSEQGSVEHRLEADHLRVLLKAHQRLAQTV